LIRCQDGTENLISHPPPANQNPCDLDESNAAGSI
jgi:hypothetical protein